jgi:hypothetical protein
MLKLVEILLAERADMNERTARGFWLREVIVFLGNLLAL